MSPAKSGAALLALLIAVSFPAYSAESELQGYTPPPMFGGTSTPLSPPVAAPKFEVPAAPAPETKESVREEPEPLIRKPKITPKPSPKIAAPPADKEAIIVKDTPLPIKPLTPRAPTKSTVPPADKEKIPAYIPPAVKPKPVETAVAPKAPVPAVTSGISAESLLGHPVTSENVQAADDTNPLAVPVGKIDEALPLPGSVPPSKKPADKKKTPDKKVVEKKTEEKKSDKKIAPKKSEVKKTETVKTETKKPEVKKPEPKKVQVKKEEPKKLVETAKKVESAKPAPAPKLLETTPELPLPSPEKKIVAPAVKPKVEEKAYNVKGRKSMPTAMPTKVEKIELDEKSPLPPTDASPSLKSLPSMNERIIDQALEERLVDPDVKTISKAAPAPKKGDGFVNPKPLNPPPVMFRNNSRGESSNPDSTEKKKAAAQQAPAKDKVKPQLVSVEFKEAATNITDDMKNIISSSLIAKLKADSSARLQILAYASPTKDGQSSARRISLARGLSLRAYMLEKGVQPDRIDIRALGENTTEKPLDRADLMIISYK